VPTIPYRIAHIRRLQKIVMVEDQTDSRLGGPEEDRPTPTEWGSLTGVVWGWGQAGHRESSKRGHSLRNRWQRGSALTLVIDPDADLPARQGTAAWAPSAPFSSAARRQVRQSDCRAVIVIKILGAPCALVTAP
jgi:hypothetical protein